MRSGRFGFREAPLKKEEHRGSRMHLDNRITDPLFAATAFDPLTPEQKKMVEEKLVERARKAGAV